MSMQRFLVGGSQPLGDNEIGVIAASSELARDGHVLIVRGLSLDNYRRNPVVLWNHDPDSPIGACTAIDVVGDDLAARIELSSASERSREAIAFAKGGIIKGVSVGFDVIDAEPLDPSRGARGGLRITSSELFEISLVAINADVNALIVARGHRAQRGAAAVLRSLPACSDAAIERALSQVGRAIPGQRPIGLMSPYERAALYQRASAARTMSAWALQQGERERERDLSFEQRQADLRRLSNEH